MSGLYGASLYGYGLYGFGAALSLYLTNTPSVVVTPLGNKLYTTLGTPTTGAQKTTMGTATHYGILMTSAGTTWPSALSIPAQNNDGWLIDGTTLDGQDLIAGSYTAAITLLSSGTGAVALTADLYVRVSKYSSGVYTTILTMSLTGQTIPITTGATFNFSGSTGSATSFAAGEKIYVDLIANITSGGSTAGQGITVQKLSNDTTGFTGSSLAQIVTPGFQPTAGTTTTVETVTETATGSEIITASTLTVNVETVTETATGSEVITASAIVALTTTIEAVAETATGSEVVTSSAIAINKSIVTETATGSEVISAQLLIGSAPGAQMQQADLTYQYNRILTSPAGMQIQTLATVYYVNPNLQAIYGELDALLSGEDISKLHAMRTPNDVTNFLKAFEYMGNVLGDNAIAYYRFNELGNVYAYDYTGKNYTANLFGGVTPGQSPGPLAVSSDGAYLFDGTSGYVQLNAGVNPQAWTQICVEAWIKLSTATFATAPRIIANGKPSTTNNGFALFVNANGVGATFNAGNGSGFGSATCTTALSAGAWYHIVGTWDGSTMRVFINGAQTGSAAWAGGSLSYSGFPINIGRNPSGADNYFPGQIAQVAPYRTALSSSRLLAHYNAAIAP